ncbi:Cif family virulence factor [Pedobacter sp.]
MMKQKILAVLILGVTIVNTLKANDKPGANTYQSVVKAYMQSYLSNDYKKFKSLLSDDALFSFNRDVRVVKHDAAAIIAEMKKNGGTVQQSCEISSKVLTATEGLVMAEVNVNYKGFDGKHKNYLVLERDKNGDWKITNIYRLFVNGSDDKAEKVIV